MISGTGSRPAITAQSPLASPGAQPVGTKDWSYTVPVGKRFRLDALTCSWELAGVAGSRLGYFDIKTSTGLTIQRIPATGNWADHTSGTHFSYCMWPGAPVSDEANQTDKYRPLMDICELPAGCVMGFHMTGVLETDYVEIDWVAKMVDS